MGTDKCATSDTFVCKLIFIKLFLINEYVHMVRSGIHRRLLHFDLLAPDAPPKWHRFRHGDGHPNYKKLKNLKNIK